MKEYNKNKFKTEYEKEIEEMADVLMKCRTYPCTECKYWNGHFCENGFLGKAEALWNAGYRKIDGENFVSIDWHNEQIMKAEQEIIDLRNKMFLLYYRTNEGEKLQQEVCRDNAKIRKNNVIEFAQRLKHRISYMPDDLQMLLCGIIDSEKEMIE